MLDKMAERVARAWQGLTADPELKAIGAPDWQGLLDFIAQLMQIIAPFISACPTNASKIRSRAKAWADALAGGRKELRDMGFMERVRFRLWQRRVNLAIGSEVGGEINNEEFQEAILRVTSEASDEELAEVRAEAERLNDADA